MQKVVTQSKYNISHRGLNGLAGNAVSLSKDLRQISQIQRQTDKDRGNYTYRQIQIQN